jgi:hypothetical protein
MLPKLLQILMMLGRRAGHATYHVGEALGRAVESIPGLPWRGLSALHGVGSAGTRNLASAFRGLSGGAQSGIYHTGQGLGRVFDDPKGTAQSLMSGLRTAGRGVWNGTTGTRGAIGRYFANYSPHLRNVWEHTKTIGGNALHGLGRMVPSSVARGAGMIGAAGAGALSLGMKSLAAPMKATAGLFDKLGSSGGGLFKSVTLFRQLVAPAALTGMVYGLKSFVGHVVESNRALGKWNGRLGASFSMLDIQKMRMDIRTANATSGSGAELNKSFSELLNEFQPIREGLARGMNLLAITATKLTTTGLQTLKELVKVFPKLQELIDAIEKMEEALQGKKQLNYQGNLQLIELARMGAADPKPVAKPRQFLDDRIAPAMDKDEAARARRMILRGQM